MNRCPIGTIHVTGSVTITGNFLGTTPQGGPLTDGSPQNRGIYALGAQTEPETTDVVVGGPDPADRNLISGHTRFQLSEGVRGQFYTRLTVQGNLIGVDATASYTISNGIGVFSGATPAPVVGGPGANEGNVIGGSLSAGYLRRRPRSSRATSSGPTAPRRPPSETSAAASSAAFPEEARSGGWDPAKATSSRGTAEEGSAATRRACSSPGAT